MATDPIEIKEDLEKESGVALQIPPSRLSYDDLPLEQRKEEYVC